MNTPKQRLQQEVARFREWADGYAKAQEILSGEWECEYEEWQSLYVAVFSLLNAVPVSEWDEETTEVTSVCPCPR